MQDQSKSEIIKGLIKKGFDSELISLELDIPLQEIKEYQKETKSEKDKAQQPETFSKMEKVRERYFSLLSQTTQSKGNATIKISETDLEKVRKSIEKIKQQIQGKENVSKTKAKEILVSIFEELKTILSYELPFKEAEEISDLINSSEMQNLTKIFQYNKLVVQAMQKTNRNSNIRLANAIITEIGKTEDLEELQRLKRRVTPEMQQQIPLKADMIKTQINYKLSVSRQKNAINKIKTEIPANISGIITDLANDELDTQKAKAIIEEEAKKRMQSKPKNRFSLTEEQEINQILIQIKTCIRERFEEYPIRNPERAILQLQELGNGETGTILNAVIYNLIGRKRFETAKITCRSFSAKDQSNTMKNYIRILQNAIRAAEIEAFVLKAITYKGTPTEENAYFNQIEARIKRGDIKPEAVSLGKSKDGIRTITLADVWNERKNKNTIEATR